MTAIYKLKFWFEWLADTAFQSANDATRNRFGEGMIAPDQFPLSSETIAQVHFMSQWHDHALDWSNLAGPLLWAQDESDRFNAASRQLYHQVVAELGSDFEVVYTQDNFTDD
jgi:hypothetical protein